MKIIINETGEHKTLTCIDPANGVDCVNDLIGNTGAIGDYIRYDAAEDVHRMDANQYAWWSNYIKNFLADREKWKDLTAEYNRAEVDDIVRDELQNIEMDGEHDAFLNAFERIRTELTSRK